MEERTLPELAIGWADEMTDEEKSGKVISGGAVYETQEDELASVNPETGLEPTDPRSMGPNWSNISIAALERGADESTTEAVEAAIAEVEALAQES